VQRAELVALVFQKSCVALATCFHWQHRSFACGPPRSGPNKFPSTYSLQTGPLVNCASPSARILY